MLETGDWRLEDWENTKSKLSSRGQKIILPRFRLVEQMGKASYIIYIHIYLYMHAYTCSSALHEPYRELYITRSLNPISWTIQTQNQTLMVRSQREVRTT